MVYETFALNKKECTVNYFECPSWENLVSRQITVLIVCCAKNHTCYKYEHVIL